MSTEAARAGAAAHLTGLAWPFDPANAARVAGWGFWLAVFGIALTIGGFIITIMQLRKTKSAADAAKLESERIQRSLNRYEIINEVTRASTALLTARNYARSGMWVQASDSYEIVLHGLKALSADAKDLTDEHRTAIEAACRYITRLCERVEADRSRGESSINESKTMTVMRNHYILLNEIARVIEKGVLDDR